MGRSKRDAVSRARSDVALVVSRSMRALKHAIGFRPPAEIREAFSLPQKEAPQWTHAALRLGGTFITVQGQAATPADRQQLSVVVVAPAASLEAWQQQANAFRGMKPKVIEAVVSPLPEKSSKDS